MALAALACKLFSVLSVLLVYSLPFALAFDHIEHAYITCGSTVPAYIRRISIRLAPQLGPPRQLSALIVFVALRLTSSVCCFHCSLASMVNQVLARHFRSYLTPLSLDRRFCVDALA